MKHHRIDITRLSVFYALSLLLVSGYLIYSRFYYGNGFPLDDAWIHQTYARNFAETGQWFFQSREASGGSTAPLWTFMLTAGYLLSIPPLIWSAFLGAVFLALTAYFSAEVYSLRNRIGASLSLIVGAAMLLEWHLLWSAVSGMETIAAIFWVMFVLYLLEKHPQRSFITGVFIGLGIWIRPDLITLVLPAVWAAVFTYYGNKRKLFTYFLLLTAGLSILIVPYLVMNRFLSGEFWPTTFYAKQAEYAVVREVHLIRRIIRQFLQPITGVGGVLLPGILFTVISSARRKRWGELAPLIWVFGYLTMFAVRLPVTYQHGRYAMPTVAVIVMLGVEGMILMGRWNSRKMIPRITSRAWVVSSVLILLSFTGIGASAYAEDVAIIETEMVAIAKWLSENTEVDDLIAAHDIGALGYFSNRTLIDLAGLISPEVIPILRDEISLQAYLIEKDVDYLVTFPDWYPELTAAGSLVFQTDAEHSLRAGGENMAVYRWGNATFAP
jgi:hypothetical protein